MVDAAQTRAVAVFIWLPMHKEWSLTYIALGSRRSTPDYWRDRSGEMGHACLLLTDDGSASIFEDGKETRYPSAAARMAWRMTRDLVT